MKRNNLFAAIILIFTLLSSANAQEGLLTLNDIYASGKYQMNRFGPARWLKDGKGYTSLERSESNRGYDIVRYDAKTGKRDLLVPAASLIPEGSKDPLIIEDYEWSPANSKLLIFTNSKRVWRRNTRGDYWVYYRDSGKLQKLGSTVPHSTMMFAKFSPDDKKVAFVSKSNLYVEDLENGSINAITSDGGGNIINGTFDWVYEEELDCRDGFRWSPDSKYIAYWQINTEGINNFYLINNIDSLYPKLIPIPYPKVGTTNPSAKIGVIPVEGGETVWMKTGGDPRNTYLARMDFAGENELVIQQLNRLQNINKVMLANIFNGNTKVIVEETDKAWVDIHDDLFWLDGGKYFTWSSERSGWNNLYKISRDGSEVLNLTPGKYDMIRLQMVDEKAGYIYFIASPDNPTEQYLYRTKMDGKGKLELLSPAEDHGQHSYQVSPGAKFAIHTFNSTSVANTIDLVSLPGHKTIRMLENNSRIKEAYAKLKINQKEFFTVDIGNGVKLNAWMIKPYNFDPTKKYPLLFYVYGEPASSTTQNTFGGGDLWHQFIAQQGYIVISVDNRGTKMPRGRDWRKSIYRQIGILASSDQAAAARKILETYKFIDPDRVGIWGWSGGGSMTLNCMFRYPEIYKTGIAVAFVANQKFYDSIYQERYMGLPDDNEEGYRDGSPYSHASNLQGNLMLIHGSGDDNVHYQNMEYLVNELIKDNKMFSMMEYPMRSHGIYERENTSRHLRETMYKFLSEHMKPGPIEP
jgi:dipeptidyl-peptidase 4